VTALRVIGRRRFLLGTGALIATPFALPIESRGNTPRVGFLISETLAGQVSRIEALRAGLRDLGYVEGKNIVIELRPADGDYDRLPQLAAELVRLKVDVLVAFGGKAILAPRQATTTIPIVAPTSGDPITAGLTSSLARPSGNITGSAIFTPELSMKTLELLKEAIPSVKRIAWLFNPANPNNKRGLQDMRKATTALKLELQPYEARSPKDFAGAFQAMAKARVEGVGVGRDTLFQAHANDIVTLAAKHRLPLVGPREFAEKGFLIGYGQDDEVVYRRGAYFVDRILKGAKPSDLPFERPTKFELVVNLKAAKTLGLTIPRVLLVRADRVIE
jgi:putative ABC transport system substrate-binding protein